MPLDVLGRTRATLTEPASLYQRAWRSKLLERCLRTLCALLQAVGSNARVACPLARWLSTVLFLQQAVGFNARGLESTRPLTAAASILHHLHIVCILGHDRDSLSMDPSLYTLAQWCNGKEKQNPIRYGSISDE